MAHDPTDHVWLLSGGREEISGIYQDLWYCEEDPDNREEKWWPQGEVPPVENPSP